MRWVGKQTVDLGANTAVALCFERDAGLFSGKYADAQQNLREFLDEVKNGKGWRIERGNLYSLR